MPALDEFVAAPAFEEVCQAWLQEEVGAAAVGWWWGKARERRDGALRDVGRELDAVAVDEKGDPIAIGSCKWTTEPTPRSELAKLEALAPQLAPAGDPPTYFLFSRSGFSDQLKASAAERSDLRLVSAAELVD